MYVEVLIVEKLKSVNNIIANIVTSHNFCPDSLRNEMAISTESSVRVSSSGVRICSARTSCATCEIHTRPFQFVQLYKWQIYDSQRRRNGIRFDDFSLLTQANTGTNQLQNCHNLFHYGLSDDDVREVPRCLVSKGHFITATLVLSTRNVTY